MNLARPTFMFSLIGIVLGACSPFGSTDSEQVFDTVAGTAQEQPSLSSPSPVALNSPVPPEPVVEIELLWQATAEKVTTYHLYYGSDKSDLNQHLAIPLNELEPFEHPIFGPTFRYRLRGAPMNNQLFFALSAENEHGVSERSAIIQVTSSPEWHKLKP